jgi:hypothetical protein
MRLILDACALYPRGLRAVLLSYAEAGGFAPLWSDRIAEEWARAAGARQGPEAEAEARGVAARMAARWPEGRVTGWEALEDPAGLPDPADAHVIAAARAGGADGIVTLNIRDFPLRVLGARGLARLHPDAFLHAEWTPGGALDAALDALEARETPADPAAFRRWLKTARLPRLAKARAQG